MSDKAARKSIKPKSRILESVREDVDSLSAAGVIGRDTLLEFEALLLPKVPSYTADQIKSLRLRCIATERAFATFMNVSMSTVQKWELGVQRPTRVALKLLNIIDRKGLDVTL